MNIEILTVGSFETNCYILEKSGSLIIIDPGSSPRRIITAVGERHPEAILLTHGHFDHTGAVDKLQKEYGCPVYASREDELLMRSDLLRGFVNDSPPLTCPIQWIDTNVLNIGLFEIKVIFSPGHSAGSLMFMIEGSLFSGDTLFLESVGRTDLYSGSFSQLKQSLEVIRNLPADTPVYPGHGPSTTMIHELQHNPYM